MHHYVDIHTHQSTNQMDVLAVMNLMPDELEKGFSKDSFFSVGFHPWNIKTDMTAREMFRTVDKYLDDKQVVCVGETGIDRAVEIPLNLQEELFEMHAAASENLKKPLIIHSVRSFPEIISIRKRLKPQTAWIIHGYRSNASILEQLIKHGFYISFGSAIFMQGSKYTELLKLVPRNLLLLETDDSREDIRKVYAVAADLLEMELIELQNLIVRNANNILHA
jgi:TatD DNase family protein